MSETLAMTLVERLEDVRCDREPFTDAHKHCICRLTNEAAREITSLRAQLEEARAKAIEEVVAIAESQLEQYRAMSARLPGDSMSRELATIRAETVSLLLHPIRALIAGSTK